MSEETLWKDHPSQFLNLNRFIQSGLMVAATWILCMLLWWNLSPAGGRIVWFMLYFWIALGISLLPLASALFAFLSVQSNVFELTNQRIRLSRGVITRVTVDLELYRVKDILLEEPLAYRFMKLGNIVLITSDQANPRVVLSAIKHAEDLRELLREHVEATRDRKNVRQMDIDAETIHPK